MTLLNRVRKTLFVFLIISLGLIILIFSLLNLSYSHRLITQRINRILTTAELPIQISSIVSIRPWSVEVSDVVVLSNSGDTIMYAKTIRSSVKPLALLRKKLVLPSVYLSNPIVSISRNKRSGLLNIEEAFSSGQKDSTLNPVVAEETWDLTVGKAEISEIRVRLTDSLSGIFIHQDVSRISIKTDEMSLNRQIVHLKSLEIDGAVGSVKMIPHQENPDSGETQQWDIGLAELDLDNVNQVFDDPTERFKLELLAGEVKVKARGIDIDKRSVDLTKVFVSHFTTTVHVDAGEDTTVVARGNSNDLFPWDIRGGNVKLQELSATVLKYSQKAGDNTDTLFCIKGMTMELSDLRVSDSDVNADIESMRFDMCNGFSLNKMRGNLNSHQGAMTAYLTVETSNSSFEINGSSDDNFFDILRNPSGIRKGKIEIRNSKVSLTDIFYFRKDLIKIPVLKILSADPISFEGAVLLEDSVVTFQNLSFAQAQNFGISLQGKIENLFIKDKAAGTMHILCSGINSNWIKDLMTGLGTGMSFPDYKELSFEVTLSDSLIAPQLTFILRSDLGSINMHGSADLNKETFQMKADFHDLSLGRLSGNPLFGSFNGKADISGQGFIKLPFSCKINLSADSILFKGYSYTGTSVECSIQDEIYNIDLHVDDPSFKLDLKAGIATMDSSLHVTSEAGFRANLKKLHLISDTLSVEGSFNGDLKQENNKLSSEIHISNLNLTTPVDASTIKQINLSLKTDPGRTIFSGNGDFFKAGISVERPVNELDSVLEELKMYFRSFSLHNLSKRTEPTSSLPELNGEVNISNNKALGILTGDTTFHFSGLDFSLASRSSAKIISLKMRGSGIRYKMMKTERLDATYTDSSGNINLDLNADNCLFFSHPVNRITLSSHNEDLNGLTRLSVFGAGNRIEYDIEFSESIDTANLVVYIPSRQIILNGNRWKLDSAGLLKYNFAAKRMAPSLRMNNGSSFINLISGEKDGDLTYTFESENVVLDSLLHPFAIKGTPSGSLSGSARYTILEDKSTKMTADLQLSDVSWSDLRFNRIDIEGYVRSGTHDDFDTEVSTHLDSAAIILKGKQTSDGEKIISADFRLIPVNIIQPFVTEFLTELKGSLSGNLNIAGKDESESFTGNLIIDNGSMRINTLNSAYRLPHNLISFTGKKLVFDSFKVLDSLSNTLTVNGIIDFSNRNNVTADLGITSSNLQVLNRKEDRNSVFYGDIFINSQLTVKGPVITPVLKGKIVLTAGTDIFFREQENLSLSESEKILTFVNSNPSLQQNIEDAVPGKRLYNKTSVESVVEIDPATRINLNLSKKMFSIDLIIKGGGELNYNMLVNSRVNLSGKYEVSEGSAYLKMIGWPNKTFKISKGGFIRWDGKLDDPELNFEALNRVRSSYISPVDNKERFVDFDVSLKLSNRLSSMDVLFAINTPDQYLMSIINTMSPEDQMRQAITILLFEKINLPGISTSSSYVAEQVNQMVASQLNQLTRTTIKGLDISFGIDSYVRATESGGQQTQTSLSYEVKRKLLNDRAQIELTGRFNDLNRQSNSQDHSLTNFTFEYRLDSASTKFLKVYNEHTYEDVFEGEIIKTGIGITYRKSYHSMGDIWRRDEKKRKQGNSVK